MRKQLLGAWVPPGRKRRHKMAMGASLASAAAICLSWAGTAGATSTPPVNPTVNSPATGANYTVPGAQPGNSFIIGGGSATTYNMMQALDTLFNATPGCNITTSSFTYVTPASGQQLNFSCIVTTVPSGSTPSGVTSEQIPAAAGDAGGAYAYLDNPVNDVALSESPFGSSNGIEALEQARNNGPSATNIGSANSTENVSLINYARSSRVLGKNDVQGLNFVAYAVDGVSWIHWTKTTSGGATPSAHVSNLTQTQLQGIWDGTIYNWAQVDGKNAPIKVYSAQEGSGTQATWKGFMGFDPSATTNPVNCSSDPTPTGKGTALTFPAGPGSGCSGPNLIFENELSSVSSSDYQDAIFFYSAGKYAVQCAGIKEKIEAADKSLLPGSVGTVNQKVGSLCGGTATTGASGKVALGEIGGVAPTPDKVLSGAFAPIRDLYNAYSNGSNPAVPVATPATLNYVSEVGFICKPQTVEGTPTGTQIDDPLTGNWYESEIDATILLQGFIPLDATDSTSLYSGITFPTQAAAGEGSVAHGAGAILADGASDSPDPGYGSTYLEATNPITGTTGNTSIPTGANPPGFCAVSTTDGNADQ